MGNNNNNTCALLLRILTFLLLLYALSLSILTITSCHFLSALTPTNESHGVGLTSFELESGECLPHSTFIHRNYNGMETLAKIGGYVAPSLGALVIISILLECCRPVLGGKFLPTLLLLGSVVCQGLTFFLFQSQLFCAKSETIDMCVMDQAAYRSVQATIWYFVSFILYLCGGTPRPLGNPMSMMKPSQQPPQQQQQGQGGGYSSNKNISNSNKPKPKKMTGDYERRRKEKRMKGRGVSGRSKQQIYQDIGDGKKSSSSKRKKSHSSSGRSGGRRSSRDNNNNHNNSTSTALVLRDRSKERTSYDDYVDTDPDGMDWSAHDPKERDEYYDRKRWKKNHPQSPAPSPSQPRRGGGENYRDRGDNYYDEEEQHYLRNGDEYSDYSRGGDDYDRNDSMYSDRSGYLGTVYDDSRYSRENSRGSRHDSYRSGRSPRDHYDNNDDDDGYVDDDYTKDVDSYGEPYDHDQDSRRGDDGYNDSYYSKRAPNDSSRYAERKPGSRGASNGGYDEASYNDESYVDSLYGEGGDYQDGRRRDDDYYDGPPLT
eukprot:CAMPEP_0201688900 /NCGR_PEP_ID=MMETSP0578-20130828/2573_1 /ASSEMBLY_ACC=CAM_ASM_000663 /TAXON_ID=267565 /ORGANISM="Skeletonema grethea, Strain CCMP 1804" /LENGTH=542 /DNA_ID=CAMNT_0048173371 /DNA_START=126 /DNA_END=1754 /DNA_ORIENTATION=+